MVLKLADLDEIYNEIVRRGARPGDTVSIEQVDNVIATMKGIGDYVIRTIKMKMVSYGYLKLSPQYPGFFILVNRSPKKNPEAEADEFLDRFKGGEKNDP